LLDSGATGLVMSSEFTRKQEFKLKKIEKPIYVRNMNGSFNKERLIEYTVEVNILLWLVYYNSEIDWKTREVKIIRCPEKCGKQ